jgi:hypothetical protein
MNSSGPHSTRGSPHRPGPKAESAWPVHDPGATRAVTAPSTNEVAQSVGAAWRLMWGEVTRTSTGEIWATRPERIGESGLTEAL